MTSLASAGRTDFPYPILRSTSFEDSLSGTGIMEDFENFAYSVMTNRRTLLQARGGAGKSWTARRIATFLDAYVPVAFIEAVSLLDVFAFDGPSVVGSDLSQLLSRAERGFNPARLESTRWGLLVLDGLNEIPTRFVDVLLSGLARLYGKHPHVSVLLTDRLTRRNLDAERWTLATLGPVPAEEAEEIAQIQEGDILPEFLTIPYYLDKYTFDAEDNMVSLHAEYLSKHAGLSASQLVDLAHFAYRMYSRDKDTVFDWSDIVNDLGLALAESLVAGGVVTQGPMRFSHHLTHDYLAAAWLANHDDLWTAEGFDALTLAGASFDALGLVLAQLPQGAIDDFVASVFDWNLYAAGVLLGEDNQVTRSIQMALRAAIVGSLAEKKLDEVAGTAQRAEDLLRIQGSDLANDMLRQRTMRGVVATMAKYAPPRHPAWFAHWRAEFECVSGRAHAHNVEALQSDNPIVGWAASNALRRLEVDEKLMESVSILARTHESASVRWRSVHALGVWPSVRAVDILMAAFDGDAVRGVRYGALRSLLDCASRAQPSLREVILGKLGDRFRVDRIVAEPSLFDECLRCLELRRPPSGWHSAVGDLLQALWTATSHTSQRDHIAESARMMRARAARIG